MTHREYRLWCDWLSAEWDRPSRTDFYLMQIAAEIKSLIMTTAGKTGKISMKDFHLKFKNAASPQQEPVEHSKARWFGMVGMK